MLQCLTFICFLLFPLLGNSSSGSLNRGIERLILLNRGQSIQKRIEGLSAAFLDSPYLADALGEGQAGQYDKNPLYRFDCFDCETYVDTVVALALAKNFEDFKNKITRLRYKAGQVNFLSRNHFPSADWIPNNRSKGYIHELTYFIAREKTRSTKAWVDRREWLRHLTIQSIHIPEFNVDERERRLIQLKKSVGCLRAREKIRIAYISIYDLLNDSLLRAKIPSGSLIFFIGHPHYLFLQIGTYMNVLHMGFAIWSEGKLYIRMASSRFGKVLDVGFQDYLKSYLPLNILQGISVWSIKPA